nr:hypothetical protein [Tanacetum cinerariifolium]
MALLPKCAKLQDDAGSSYWSDMFIFYCRRSAAEDYKFARRINILRGELSVACQEKVPNSRISNGGGVVVGLAMVAEMAKTQHLAFLTTSLQSGRKVCASWLKQVMVATAASSSMIDLK